MADAQARLDMDTEGRSIRARGDVDIHTAPRLGTRIASLPGSGDVVVDLSGVEFMDSSGLRVLIEAHQTLEAAGAALVLKSPSQVVRDLFEMTGLRSHFRIE